MTSPGSAPIRSNLRCSSSTRVAFAPSGMNLTSTSELTVVSGFHWLLMSQVTTKRVGGSQATIFPTFVCVPSSASSYHRPPRRVLMMGVNGFFPIPWSCGHHRPIPDVKILKARSALTLTRTLLRTGAILTAVVIWLYPFHASRHVQLPSGTPRAHHPRTDPTTCAGHRAHAGLCNRPGAFLLDGLPPDLPPLAP